MLKSKINNDKVKFYPKFIIKKAYYKNKNLTIVSQENKKITEKFDLIINTTY